MQTPEYSDNSAPNTVHTPHSGGHLGETYCTVQAAVVGQHQRAQTQNRAGLPRPDSSGLLAPSRTTIRLMRSQLEYSYVTDERTILPLSSGLYAPRLHGQGTSSERSTTNGAST